MRRFFGLFAALAFFIAPAMGDGMSGSVSPQAGGGINSGFDGGISGKGSGSAPPPVCSQATTFLARTSGLSGTETAAYTTMICGMVTDGIITGTLSGANGCGSVLDALWILATNSTITAALNLCGTNFSLTSTGSPTFTADVGYTGNGSSTFLNTQYTPSTAGLNYTLNGGSVGAFVQTNRAADSGTIVAGVGHDAGAGWIILAPYEGSNVSQYDINDATFETTPNTSSKGALIASRTTSTAVALYRNGSSTPIGTSTASTSGLSLESKPIYLLGLNNAGTLSNASSDQISAAFIGGALTGSQAVAINNRINAYMAALGVNVY